MTEHGEAVLDFEMRSESHAHVQQLAHHGLPGAGLRHRDGHAA